MLATRTTTPPERLGPQPGHGRVVSHDLASLEANSDLPEVQALIREAIRLGKVRALPAPGAPDRVSLVRVPHGGA